MSNRIQQSTQMLNQLQSSDSIGCATILNNITGGASLPVPAKVLTLVDKLTVRTMARFRAYLTTVNMVIDSDPKVDQLISGVILRCSAEGHRDELASKLSTACAKELIRVAIAETIDDVCNQHLSNFIRDNVRNELAQAKAKNLTDIYRKLVPIVVRECVISCVADVAYDQYMSARNNVQMEELRSYLGVEEVAKVV